MASQVAVTVAVSGSVPAVSVTWATPDEFVVAEVELKTPASVAKVTSLFASRPPSRSRTQADIVEVVSPSGGIRPGFALADTTIPDLLASVKPTSAWSSSGTTTT